MQWIFYRADAKAKTHVLVPAPVIGGQQYMLPPLNAEEWMDTNLFFDSMVPRGVVLDAEGKYGFRGLCLAVDG